MCRQKFPFLYHPCNCNCLHPTKFKAFLTWLKTWGPLGVGRRHLHRYHHHQHRHHCSHRRRHEESKGIAFYIKTREDSQSLSLFHPTTALGSDNDRDTIVQELLENYHRRPHPDHHDPHVHHRDYKKHQKLLQSLRCRRPKVGKWDGGKFLKQENGAENYKAGKK